MFGKMLPPLNDVVFWMLASEEYKDDFLVPFLLCALRIPEEEYDHIEFCDPRTPIEKIDEKRGIVDVLLHTRSGIIIHIEVQLKLYSWMCERVVFYHAKNLSGQLLRGDDYKEIRKTVTILIVGFDLKKDELGYFCRYLYCNPETGVIFTDISEIITLDLTKMPTSDDNTLIWPWTKYFTSKKEEEFDMLVQNHPAMQKPVAALKTLSSDTTVRLLAEERERWHRDIVSMSNEERAIGRSEMSAEIARTMINDGEADEKINRYTGLTFLEIKSLRARNGV